MKVFPLKKTYMFLGKNTEGQNRRGVLLANIPSYHGNRAYHFLHFKRRPSSPYFTLLVFWGRAPWYKIVAFWGQAPRNHNLPKLPAERSVNLYLIDILRTNPIKITIFSCYRHIFQLEHITIHENCATKEPASHFTLLVLWGLPPWYAKWFFRGRLFKVII